MKRRYCFKDGRVTVQSSLYDLLTEKPRPPSQQVVLLITHAATRIQRGQQEVEHDPTEQE